jgi:hypothetical protein
MKCTAALPRGFEHLRNRRLEPFMGVRDHQLDAGQSALLQRAQEPQPEGRGFRRAEPQPQDLAAAVEIDAGGDYRRHRDDAAAVTDLQIRGVEPEIQPFALDWPVEKGIDALVNLAAELADLALGNAAHPHRLHQFVDLAGRYALDPGLLDDRDQCPLGGLARLQEGREITAAPQLRDLQFQRPQPGLEIAFAVAVAVRRALVAAFVPAGTDLAFDLELHQTLQHRLRQILEKIPAASIPQQLQECHSVIGHRVELRWMIEPRQLNLTEEAR